MAKRFIDLSCPLEKEENLPEHGVKYGYYIRKPILTLAKDRIVCEQIGMWNHWGTHVDAPAHIFFRDEKSGIYWLNDYPLDKFYGEALCLDIPKGPKEVITPEDMERTAVGDLEIHENDIVCVHTGWGDMKNIYGPMRRDGPNYHGVNSPGLGPEGAEWLVKKKVKAYGCDTMGVNSQQWPLPAGTDFRKTGKPIREWIEPVHKILLGHDILQIEIMTNLDQVVGKRFTLLAFPLNFLEIDASPCRAIAILDE